VIAAVADDELRARLAQRMADPAFQASFESEVRQFSEEDWSEMQAGAPRQPTLDQAIAGEVGGGALSFGGPRAEDGYQAAAREVMEGDPAIAAVIMGHTHEAIDGLVSPLYMTGDHTGYYFNSGTWTPHLRDRPNYTYTWAEIGDSSNYTSSFTYLRFVPDQQGRYQVELHNWAAEWDGSR
jgi:hypothetical protein